MKILSLIGSYKGTIDSVTINKTVKEVLEKEGHTVEAIPVADGGDGLLDSLISSFSGKYIEIPTENALGEKIISKAGIAGNTGIVEMALASGLALLDENSLNIMKSSTYGTGILIKHLCETGISDLILGIGGSATNDGGMGALCALGFAFFDEKGDELLPYAENLIKIKSVSDKNVSEKIKNLKIKIACDVTNPLLGENGATYIYSKQKGADEETQKLLEKGMENFAKVTSKYCNNDNSTLPGTGAAGGLGFGLLSYLGAVLQKGAEIVLEKAGYCEKLKNCGLVITGEGQIDNQTEFGKLPQIVAAKAKENNVKCIALCGSSKADELSLKRMGIEKVYSLVDFAPLLQCMTNTKAVIEKSLKNIAKEIN